MTGKFTEYLYEKARPIWEASHQHPFVTGIGDGSLPVEKFRFFMCQDYVYLKDYAKLFAMGAIKSPTLAMAGKFADLLQSTLNVEMELHRQYARKFDITAEELEATEPAPYTLAYTKYMLDAAHQGDIADLVAVLLPCMWSYWEIGVRLSENRTLTRALPEDSVYNEWIDMYASEEFAELSRWLIETMDHLAFGLPEPRLKELTNYFVTASRFEYLFWEMAYRQETWPI